MKLDYPDDPAVRDQPMLDARLHLLDRQVLDVAGVPVTAVDDLELTDPGDPKSLGPAEEAPAVSALLSGASLATRIFGGRPPRSALHTIGWDEVFDVGVAITLAVRADSLEVGWTERWVRDHIIAHIPGGRHAPQ